MEESSLQHPFRVIGTLSRSMGVKLLVICVLAMMTLVPALFVWDLLRERTQRSEDVTKEVSSFLGGQQTFLGPTLAVPYSVPPQAAGYQTEHGVYLVFPDQASATVESTTQERHRAIFKVPVFQADLKFDANFDLTGVPAAAPQGAVLDWSNAEFVLGVTDPRGALGDGQLTAAGKTGTLVPAGIAQSLNVGDQGQQLKLTLFGVKTGDAVKPNAQVKVTSTLRFSGAQRLAVLAYGKTTKVTARGDWRAPSFDGGFLPLRQEESQAGFTAEWTVPFIARGVRAEGSSETIGGLASTALGVSFKELVDPYQSVERALKYFLLFEGLIFLAYFVFEVTSGRRVHPAQYILVGVAQIIFYLLLLSLAERIGFDFGFLIAGSATVLLLSLNVSWIFVSRLQGLRALIVFSLLYSLIYMLLRLEDNALLVGAIASFAAVTAAMYFSRGIDWYSSHSPTGSDSRTQASVVPKANF
jgi:inner membrane protein